MEKQDDYKYIYGEPFSGTYETIIPDSIWNLNSKYLVSKEELADLYNCKMKRLPTAKWNGNTVFEEDVLMLFREKTEVLKHVTTDINELEKRKSPYIDRYISISKYLDLMGIDMSTFRPKKDSPCKENDNNIVKEISCAKEIIRLSSLVRSYIALNEYAKSLMVQIEELKRIYDSLRNAPELDNPDVELFDKKQYKKSSI